MQYGCTRVKFGLDFPVICCCDKSLGSLISLQTKYVCAP